MCSRVATGGLLKSSASGSLIRFKNDYCRNGFMGLGRCFGGSMANFLRVIFLLALWLVGGAAYASFPATPAPLPSQCPLTSPHGDVCRSYIAANLYGPGGVCSVAYVNGSCIVKLTTSTQVVNGVEGWSPAVLPATCPAGASLSGSTCTCVAPSVESAGACVSPCLATAGATGYMQNGGLVPSYGKTICDASSCSVTVSGGWCTLQGGVRSCTAEVKSTGSSCTPPAGPVSTSPASNAPSPTTTEPLKPPSPCKGSAGQVNGVDVCIPVNPSTVTDQVTGATKTTTPSTGGTSGTDTAGPVTSQEKTTNCVGGKCTTTTTTTTVTPGVNGGPATTTTSAEKTEQPKESFCETNPNLLICKTSAIGGGSCAAADSCDGDAIQCAIAARNLRIQCALSPTPDGSDADYIAGKALTGKQTSNLPDNGSVNIGAGSFDTSDALGGGSCIADKQVVIAGASISIPFSSVCVHLAMLGNVLLMVSFLLAGRIVVRG